MWVRPSVHILGPLVIFFIITSRLIYGISFFIGRDDNRHDISLEELQVEQNSSYLIPPIVHQVFHDWGHSQMDPRWKSARQTCIDMHPDYTFLLWNDSNSRHLLETHYPWFLPTYDSYQYPVQRVDTIRLFVLLHMGGIYLDLDQGCRSRLDPLRTFPGFVSGNQRSSGISNGVMASKAEHPFLDYLTRTLPHHNWNWISPYLTIMSSTGSHMLSYAWKDYQHLPIAKSDAGKMRKCLPETCGMGDNMFFIDVPGNSWHTWDTLFFLWEILGISTLIWAVTWTLYRVLRGALKSVGSAYRRHRRYTVRQRKDYS